MASLIPPEVIEQMLVRQQQAAAGTPPAQPMARGLDSFNPAHQLQMAQAMRSSRSPTVGPHAGTSPLQEEIQRAKLAAMQQKAQPAAQHDFSSQPSDPNAGTMSIAPAGRNPAVQQTREAEFAAHQQGMNVRTAPNGGFSVSGLGDTPQADPTVAMVNAFKGHVPDELLASAQAAINGGMKPDQVFAHLQQAAAQQQKPVSGNGAEGKERTTMLQAKLHHLESQQQHATENGENPAEYEKQIQDAIGQLGPQQQAAAPQGQQQTAPQATATNPQTGQKMHFLNGKWVPA